MSSGGIPFIGPILSAFGSIKGGYASSNQAKYQAQVASNNALIQRRNAQMAGAATAANEERAALEARAKSGTVRAGLAANNLDVNSGSPEAVQTSQRELGNLDVGNVQRQGALEAYGYQVQATSEDAQAALLRKQASSDVTAGYINAGVEIAGSPATANLLGDPFSSSASSGSGAQTFEPGATGAPASLMSGSPTVPDEYQWMQESGGLY